MMKVDGRAEISCKFKFVYHSESKKKKSGMISLFTPQIWKGEGQAGGGDDDGGPSKG